MTLGSFPITIELILWIGAIPAMIMVIHDKPTRCEDATEFGMAAFLFLVLRYLALTWVIAAVVAFF
tara:strand:- start:294 stop:491 length:198 start_codon:yes stop_codon:yes gene_type:complete